MGAHDTWFDLIPGFKQLTDSLQGPLGRTWTWQVFQTTHFEISHVMVALVVALLLIVAAAKYRSSVAALGEEAILPPAKIGVRAIMEGLADMVFGLLEGVMGEKNARKYLPFLGSFFVFILASNLISLVPGFRSPSDTLKTNIALAILIFVATHVLGIKEHGLSYLKQFTGHLPLNSFLVILVPLIFAIEVISHLIRPATLAIRLMANMFADHAVVSVFFMLVPFLVPVPLMVLGLFVSVVQAVVFTLMSATYINLAVAHEEH